MEKISKDEFDKVIKKCAGSKTSEFYSLLQSLEVGEAASINLDEWKLKTDPRKTALVSTFHPRGRLFGKRFESKNVLVNDKVVSWVFLRVK